MYYVQVKVEGDVVDRAYHDNMPTVSRFIFVTPKMLRAIADRMESQTENGLAARSQVVYPLIPEITLYYDPARDYSHKTPIKVSCDHVPLVPHD